MMESAYNDVEDEDLTTSPEAIERPKFVLAPATLIFERKQNMTSDVPLLTPNKESGPKESIQTSKVPSDTERPLSSIKRIKLAHEMPTAGVLVSSNTKEFENLSYDLTKEVTSSGLFPGVLQSSKNLSIPSSSGEVGLANPWRMNSMLFSPMNSNHLPHLNESMSSSNDFVFGQNLQERIELKDGQSPGSIAKSSVPLTFEEAKLGTTEDFDKYPTKSVLKSAIEVESKRIKMQFGEVSTFSGEEGECNVLQINCKLYVFGMLKSGVQNWVEKGKGVLRVNDSEVEETTTSQSRIIVRASGNQRVILNAKIKSHMNLNKPSSKTVQFSVVDNEGSNLYLVATQPKSAEELYKALKSRIKMQKKQCRN